MDVSTAQKLSPQEVELIRKWMATQKPKGEFCKELGITYKTLQKYVERIKKEKKP